MADPGQASSSSPTAAASSSVRARSFAKPERVLSCIQCQQRKVKCDRKFPCANCTKSAVQCIPGAMVPRERRRRFPERELLDRLRQYEKLLAEHKIEFKPLHAPSANDRTRASTLSSPSSAGIAGQSPGQDAEGMPTAMPEVRNFWYLMKTMSFNSKDQSRREFSENSDDDDFEDDDSSDEGVIMREATIRKAYDQSFSSNDHLLFGSHGASVNLFALHPQQVHIFKLWQIYLQNIDPLIKVTHTPTLQPRIVDAAGNLLNVKPVLEALMFSIYCVALQSLDDQECTAIFGSPKEPLLAGYHFACKHALLNCQILRSHDRHALTALFLYLVSANADTDPRALSSMLGVAIRIAQAMGLPNESLNAKYAPFEAEMRHRLWWALVVFDNRISEMSDHKVTMLVPSWDCHIPLNLNDADIWPDMKELPKAGDRPTEAIFTVLRSELGNHNRHNSLHLDTTNPMLKIFAKYATSQRPLFADARELEKMFEDKYLQYCNPDNALQCMALGMIRAQVAREFLGESFFRSASPSTADTDAQRQVLLSRSVCLLENDTNLMTLPLTKGFSWILHFHFPLPAYFCIIQNLRKMPLHDQAEHFWAVMGKNYEVRFPSGPNQDLPFVIFARLILQGWRARDAALKQNDQPSEQPYMVRDIIRNMKRGQEAGDASLANIDEILGLSPNDIDILSSVGYADTGMSFGFGDDETGLPGTSFGGEQMDWNNPVWNPGQPQGW